MKSTTTLSASLLSVSLLLSASGYAQEDAYLKPAVEKATEINDSAANSQKKINKINDQIDNKLQQFKAINKETEGLEVYNTQLRKQIENQVQEMADLNLSLIHI